ncbi:Odorant receptor 238 [Nylanderia fulva]|uniref:Odorant receptor n=1 Tax=Nylanderia fulva TaxID=613905 RepID=A0A6G1LP70_9HYME|nr:uncharacterized protein LOC114944096 [Nylanderia fulva]KAF3054251.1 Odorant receptor 238 [Nylanderia fulva]
MTDRAQYFSLNRILLVTVGLWPYEQSKFDRLWFIFLFSILTTAILFQFTTFFTSKYTTDFFIEVLTNALFFTIFAIKYIFFAINIEAVKNLLTQFQHIHDHLKNKYECAIIEKYSYDAKRYTTGLTVFYICGIIILVGIQCTFNITGAILQTNVSQPRRLPITTEYFVDQEKYFFLMLVHLNAALCIGTGAMVATGAMLIAYLIHMCGLFKIASYRIEHAMRVSMLENITPEKNILILKEIKCAVDIHRQAMKLSKFLVSKFEAMLFCLITTGVTSLSLNLLQIFRLMSSGANIDEIFNPSLFTLVSVIYMFCANYMGQHLTDHNKHIFVAAYNVQWYIAPLRIQRLILFLLQRNAQEFTVGVGGLFTGSLECFATLVKASVSYFTVIYSTQ